MGEKDIRTTSPGRSIAHVAAGRVCLSREEIGQIQGVEGALKDLLRRAAEVLATSLAVVELPDKQLTVRVDADERALPNAGKVVRALQVRLAARVKGAAAAEELAFEPPGCGASFVAPVVSDVGRFEGALLLVRGEEGESFSRREQDLLNAIAVNIGEIIGARFDSLTGLVNQREFEHVLEKSIEGRQSRQFSHSVLHVNLDHIQSINDSFGADAADIAICEAAATLRTVLDAPAVIAHTGRDEFGVLLRDCPADRGWAIGQDIRRAIRDMSIAYKEPLKLTASIGVAERNEFNMTPEEVLKAADKALYRAKEQGRNRVVCSGRAG